MIKIKKVLNSSVVLVTRDDKEQILFGKGIGYGKTPGTIIPEEAVDQVFMPIESTQAQQILELIDSIPAIYFELTQEIVQYAETQLGTRLNSSIYFTLMDHLNFAVERLKKQMIITNRVYWEMKNYYPEEFEVGQFAVNLLNENLNIELPLEEAANITFHLINAQSSESNSADGMKYAKMIGGIVNLVRYSLSINLNTESIHYVRFITHVKFFVERFFADKLLYEEDQALFEQIATLYPQAMSGAFKIKDYVEKLYASEIPNTELTYLAIHINRLINHSELGD